MAEQTRSGQFASAIAGEVETDVLKAFDVLKQKGAELFKKREAALADGSWKKLAEDNPKIRGEKLLKLFDESLYNELHRHAKFLKSYRRLLNTLTQTDPEFLETHGLLDKITSLDDSKGITDDYLHNLKKLGDNWDSNIAYFKKGVNAFRDKELAIGHHSISGSTLRDTLIKLGRNSKGKEFRAALLKEAKARGLRIGEEFMKYLDPWAHKDDTTKFKGRLKLLFPDQYGPDGKLKPGAFSDPIFKPLFQFAEGLYAHSWWAGGTTGNKLDPDLIVPSEGVDKNVNVLKSLVDIDQIATDTATQFDNAISAVLKEVQENNISDNNKVAVILSNKLKSINDNLPDIPELYRQAIEHGHRFSKPRLSGINKHWGSALSNLPPNTGKYALLAGGTLLNLGVQGVADAATAPPVWHQLGRLQKAKEEGDEETASQATSDLGTEAAFAVGTGLASSALIGKLGLAKYFMNPVTAVPMVGTAAYLGIDAYMEGRDMIGPTQRWANLFKFDQNIIDERTGEREFIPRPERQEAREDLAGAINRIGEERAKDPNNLDSFLTRFGL